MPKFIVSGVRIIQENNNIFSGCIWDLEYSLDRRKVQRRSLNNTKLERLEDDKEGPHFHYDRFTPIGRRREKKNGIKEPNPPFSFSDFCADPGIWRNYYSGFSGAPSQFWVI